MVVMCQMLPTALTHNLQEIATLPCSTSAAILLNLLHLLNSMDGGWGKQRKGCFVHLKPHLLCGLQFVQLLLPLVFNGTC